MTSCFIKSRIFASLKTKPFQFAQALRPTPFLRWTSTVSTPATLSSSLGQTLQFITDIKLQELEKQRLAYHAHAKVLEEARTLGENGEILKKVEVLAKAVKSWTGSGGVDELKVVGGSLQLTNLDFWLQQAKKDPSFSREIAQGWAHTLEDHIRHTIGRFDSAKLFGRLFNDWLSSGDSVALAYQASSDDLDNPLNPLGPTGTETATSSAQAGRKEMYEQKEQFVSIIFDEHLVDIENLKIYLNGLFESEEATKELEKLRKEMKNFSYWLKRTPINKKDVKSAINGLLASNLMGEEKRTTLKAFLQNPTLLDEIASVLNMRMASLDSWAWPKEGILVEFRRHLNGKYRAFTDPEIIDALLLHHIGVAWQVKLKHALLRIFDSKAWIRPIARETVKGQYRQFLGDDGKSSIEAKRNRTRRNDFFVAQLQDEADTPNSYYDDGLVDVPFAANLVGPPRIKQELLQIMTTECHLNAALHESHAAVCSDFQWFGPSLPHASILTVLEFLGMSKTWLDFYKSFLATPVRFAGETECQVRKRGTPISYSLSMLGGEAVIFMMDFAVNQRANGLYVYRMHDDLWLWDADARKVADGWEEMKKYAGLVGLKFNEEKTGSAYVGPKYGHSARLPKGDIRWGFLKFNPEESRFVIDQKQVDGHIVEMRRQLASTSSVFGWINVYNKYMAFFMRNFGGIPANCFGQSHIVDMIDTLARIQRELFPDSTKDENGGAIGYLKKTLKDQFGASDLPEGYFYFPIGRGGLELRNAMLELFALQRKDKPLATYGDDKYGVLDSESEPERRLEDKDLNDAFDEDKAIAEHKFKKRVENDPKEYARLKEAWDNRDEQTQQTHLNTEEFLSFEAFTSLRESWLSTWGDSYQHMLQTPSIRYVAPVPKMKELLSSSTKPWEHMDWYEQWVVSMYGEDVVKKFGSLEAVDPNLIPVGMVQLFRRSRMKLDQ
ncbi:hypothetical protein GALMADRAFT_119220 [Galerina marginata CBS 339.88]|uniref:Reverse transcriptase domain-containing protein n=1 Tax=Galerina marginata (strain CBS 339.88) TaxID=685588 RepID=A0A067T4W4_GALM3|nr:hypothetical protein GALMADRAFT_119220 [Galerina marginata CBS 339.88]